MTPCRLPVAVEEPGVGVNGCAVAGHAVHDARNGPRRCAAMLGGLPVVFLGGCFEGAGWCALMVFLVCFEGSLVCFEGAGWCGLRVLRAGRGRLYIARKHWCAFGVLSCVLWGGTARNGAEAENAKTPENIGFFACFRGFEDGAGCGARSRNNQIHNLVLYQLS